MVKAGSYSLNWTKISGYGRLALGAWGHGLLHPTFEGRYDPGRTWARLQTIVPEGAELAILGDTHGEFAFASRRNTALIGLRNDDELVQWLQDHGDNGVLLFRVNEGMRQAYLDTVAWRAQSKYANDPEPMPPVPWRAGWLQPTPSSELNEYLEFVRSGVVPSSIRKRMDNE